MFGYIIVNKGDLTYREFDVYHSYYCGLCRTLKDNHGIKAQLALNYDMTFLVLLLTSLYEPQTEYRMEKCVAHPFDKHGTSLNDITKYVADMNMLIADYKCMDDWADEKKITRKVYGEAIRKDVQKLKKCYSEKAEIIQVSFRNLNKLEKEKCYNVDKMAGVFGKVMEELFVYKEDEWETILRQIGFQLGKFIYLLDAYEDIENDLKKGRYNPFTLKYMDEDFEEQCKIVLTAAIANCTKNFEMLPLIDNVNILRNILYSGVWYRYEKIRAKRKEESNGSL